ncbi:MAG: tetratricopeptide repeat protein [Bacteroidia bacterium]
MHKPSKYYFYIAAIVLPAIILLSCNGPKKTATSGNAPLVQKKLTQKQQDEFTATYFEGSKEKILGNYDKALAIFNQCLAIDPYNAAANYQMADILQNFKQPDSALVYAKRAVQAEPSNKWYIDIYAQCLQETGKYKDMIGIYEELIEKYPDEIDYYYKLALAQIESSEFEKAADTYDKIEQKEGGYSEEITKEKIKIYERIKNYAKEEDQVRRLIAHDSTNIENYDLLGDVYEMEGKSDKAFELYKKMENQYPNEPSIHLSLADYYRSKHDEKKSFEELYDAFKQPTMDIDTKIKILLSFYSYSNGHDSLQTQAELLCGAMVQAQPDNPKAHTMYGDFLSRSGDYKDARDQYKITLSEDSGKFMIWSQLMAIDIQLNDFDDLAKVSAGAISLFPNQPESYLFNGVACNQQKKYDVAAASLNKGIEYVVNNNTLLVQFYATLGDIYNSLKRYSSSDSAYEEALKINPKEDNVLNNYSYYLSERDTNLAKAEEMSRKSNEISVNNGTYQDTYAWIMYKMGNFKSAKEWEEKSLMNGGQKDAAILEHYGDILFKSGDKEGAVEYWQKAKQAGSNAPLLNKKIQDKQLYEK